MPDAPSACTSRRHFSTSPCLGNSTRCLSMWETSILPYDSRAVCQADLLIVPSSFCRTVFRRAGFAGPVAVAPLGIWPEEWPEPRRDRPGDQQRRVLWVGAPDPRKGIELLQTRWKCGILARSSARPDLSMVDPSASLTIKTDGRGGCRAGGEPPAPRHHLDLGASPLACPARISTWSMMCSCFRALAKGSDCPCLEAMAAGLLVIAPAHSGLKDFVNRGNAWVIEVYEDTGAVWRVRESAPPEAEPSDVVAPHCRGGGLRVDGPPARQGEG